MPAPHDSPSHDSSPDATLAPESIEQHLELDADLAAVWDVLADPASLAGWLGESVELDLRPGGGGVVIDHDGARRDVLVTEVDAPGRIVWHWWHEDGPLSTVEIVAVPTPSGGTLVRVTETIDTTITALEASARAAIAPAGARQSVGRGGGGGGGRPSQHHAALESAWTDRLGLLRIAANRSLALVARG